MRTSVSHHVAQLLITILNEKKGKLSIVLKLLAIVPMNLHGHILDTTIFSSRWVSIINTQDTTVVNIKLETSQ